MKRGAGALLLAVAALLALLPVSAQAADWSIDSFAANLTVQANGVLNVTERIDVTFHAAHHGIFRAIPVVYDYDQKHNRVLEVDVTSISDGAEHSWPYTVARSGANDEIKIGDANHTVTGRQTYLITYTVKGAFNAFLDHDELYWNATGDQWQVAIAHATATVNGPAGSLQRQTCYQGPKGSTEPCNGSAVADTATFEATNPLPQGHGLTIVVALNKGAIPNPVPILAAKPRGFLEYFEINPATVLFSLLVLAAGLALFGRYWWLHARDRQYTTAYYTNHDLNAPDELSPMFSHRPVVPEFGPPDNLRPGQLGLILDESADTKDVTATIVDLAARGFLVIQEVPGQGFLQRTDYLLKKGANTDMTKLLLYERTLYAGIFNARDQVLLSAVKGTFKATLNKAESQLYGDAMARKWFTRNPSGIRSAWLVFGIAIILAGVVAGLALGATVGAGLVGVALVIVGVVTALSFHSMPQKTAAGHDVLTRALGFRMYMATAERYQQQFAEREKTFSAFLPFAIVFGVVEMWARAFHDIDVAAATAGWYVGAGQFSALTFSNNLQAFNSTVDNAIVYTASSSGSSGFGGGSGGGMGGGGGGSW